MSERCYTCGSLMGDKPHNCLPTVAWGERQELEAERDDAILDLANAGNGIGPFGGPVRTLRAERDRLAAELDQERAKVAGLREALVMVAQNAPGQLSRDGLRRVAEAALSELGNEDEAATATLAVVEAAVSYASVLRGIYLVGPPSQGSFERALLDAVAAYIKLRGGDANDS